MNPSQDNQFDPNMNQTNMNSNINPNNQKNFNPNPTYNNPNPNQSNPNPNYNPNMNMNQQPNQFDPNQQMYNQQQLHQNTSAQNQPQGPNFLSTTVDQFKSASNPFICISTTAFRALPIILFQLGSLILSSGTVFVLIIVLQSINFWQCKNISGRFLVGLKFQSVIRESDGESEWTQMVHPNFNSSTQDFQIFWLGLVAEIVIWTVIMAAQVVTISLSSLFLPAFCVSMSCFNFYGQWQCKSEHAAMFSKYKDGIIQGGAASQVNNMIGNNLGNNNTMNMNNNNNTMNMNNNANYNNFNNATI